MNEFGFSVRVTSREECMLVVCEPRRLFVHLCGAAAAVGVRPVKVILYRIKGADDIDRMFANQQHGHAELVRVIEKLAHEEAIEEDMPTLKLAALGALLPWWTTVCASVDSFVTAFDGVPLWTSRVAGREDQDAAVRAFLLQQ